jgi:hypothetical protein
MSADHDLLIVSNPILPQVFPNRISWIVTVLAKIGHINQILEIQMYPVSQMQRELVFKNTTTLPGGFAK